MVEVNGHHLHVYTEGEGQETLVFLSGSGTAAPSLDFKALYRKLSDKYRIAVVERAGYGFSEIAKTPRDIDTVLEETRAALVGAGEQGSFILFPHSLSGIEALYWAQKYPEEVKAIIGLDAAVPSYYLTLGEEVLSDIVNDLSKLLIYGQLGFVRLQPEIYLADPAITGDYLSAYENAELVNELKTPIQIPVLYFISDESEVGEGWRNVVTEYIELFHHGKYVFLDCGHYVHDEMPDTIAQKSTLFIESLAN